MKRQPVKKSFTRTSARRGATRYVRTDADKASAPRVARKAAASSSAGAQPVSAYVLQHLQVFFYSLGQMSRTPLSTLMTALVIGIALALPAGLYVLLDNAQRIGADWDGGVQISLFLKQEVGDEEALRLAEALRATQGISAVDIVSRAEALEEFRELSGFGKALDTLGENPLPVLLLVRPTAADDGPETSERLLASLSTQPEVEIAQLDMQWLKRLYGIMAIAERGVLILATLLALAVLVIVGNTIRLAIQSRHDEIEIIKLVGATAAFVRRPFLYSGFWYGLFGGAIAWLLLSISLGLLSQPVRQLSGLYNSNFELSGLSAQNALLLPLTGIALGLLGSALAVRRHLAAIEPT